MPIYATFHSSRLLRSRLLERRETRSTTPSFRLIPFGRTNHHTRRRRRFAEGRYFRTCTRAAVTRTKNRLGGPQSFRRKRGLAKGRPYLPVSQRHALRTNCVKPRLNANVRKPKNGLACGEVQLLMAHHTPASFSQNALGSVNNSKNRIEELFT